MGIHFQQIILFSVLPTSYFWFEHDFFVLRNLLSRSRVCARAFIFFYPVFLPSIWLNWMTRTKKENRIRLYVIIVCIAMSWKDNGKLKKNRLNSIWHTYAEIAIVVKQMIKKTNKLNSHFLFARASVWLLLGIQCAQRLYPHWWIRFHYGSVVSHFFLLWIKRAR